MVQATVNECKVTCQLYLNKLGGKVYQNSGERTSPSEVLRHMGYPRRILCISKNKLPMDKRGECCLETQREGVEQKCFRPLWRNLWRDLWSKKQSQRCSGDGLCVHQVVPSFSWVQRTPTPPPPSRGVSSGCWCVGTVMCVCPPLCAGAALHLPFTGGGQ